MSPERSRRALLASLGSVLIAGCSDSSPTETATQDTPNSTIQATPDTSPSSSCSASGDVLLTAESDVFVVEEKHDGFAFTLRNQMSSSLTIEPTEAWKLESQTADGWKQVATEGGVTTGETRTLTCGEKHTWHFALFEHPTPSGRTTTYLFKDLSDGRYRFSVTGTLDTGEEITRTTQFEVQRRISTQTGTES